MDTRVGRGAPVLKVLRGMSELKGIKVGRVSRVPRAGRGCRGTLALTGFREIRVGREPVSKDRRDGRG